MTRVTWHRLYRLAMACLVLASCEGRDPPRGDDSTAAPIPRFVQLTNGRVILGESVPPALLAAVSMQAGDTVVSLPRDTLANLERVILHLTPAGVVRGVVLDYAHDVDFEAKVAEYAARGGTPVRTREQRQGEEPADVVIWQDAQTTFTLRRDPNRSAWTIRADLRDRTPGAPSPNP